MTHNYQTAKIPARFIALLIDWILMGGVICAFLFVSMGSIPTGKRTNNEGQTSVADKYEFLSYVDSLRDPSLWDNTLPSMCKRFPLEMFVGIFLLPFLYFSFFEGKGGATIGKYITGIRVRRKDGGAINFKTAAVRHIGRIISTIIFMLGYVIAVFDSKSQTLHDKIANTLVLKK